MSASVTKADLINKISLFNSMFIDDFENNKTSKKWSDYIDPLVYKLFNMNYLEFIKTYRIDQHNSVPQAFENYYNFFYFAKNYFESLTIVSATNDIYCCCNDILEDLNTFINDNHYHLIKHKMVDNGIVWYKFEIYPLIH